MAGKCCPGPKTLWGANDLLVFNKKQGWSDALGQKRKRRDVGSCFTDFCLLSSVLCDVQVLIWVFSESIEKSLVPGFSCFLIISKNSWCFGCLACGLSLQLSVFLFLSLVLSFPFQHLIFSTYSFQVCLPVRESIIYAYYICLVMPAIVFVSFSSSLWIGTLFISLSSDLFVIKVCWGAGRGGEYIKTFGYTTLK